MNRQTATALIEARLSPYRFHHSVCVAEKAQALAARYGLDSEKAYLTGLLHDITKEDNAETQRAEITAAGWQMSELEQHNPKVQHQLSGSAYVKNHLDITDEDILGGIRYHTTGRADMTVFEMVIYLADFTSDDREYPDVDIMRQKTDEGLYEGMLYSLQHTISGLVKKGRQIHPDTLECYNWVLAQKG